MCRMLMRLWVVVLNSPYHKAAPNALAAHKNQHLWQEQTICATVKYSVFFFFVHSGRVVKGFPFTLESICQGIKALHLFCTIGCMAPHAFITDILLHPCLKKRTIYGCARGVEVQRREWWRCINHQLDAVEPTFMTSIKGSEHRVLHLFVTEWWRCGISIPVPLTYSQVINKQVHGIMKKGVVQESASPWAAPVILVKKEIWILEILCYYWRLNAVTKKNVYPLPRSDDAIDCLHSASRLFFLSIFTISLLANPGAFWKQRKDCLCYPRWAVWI